MAERPAPLIFVVDPGPVAAAAVPGSYASAVLTGQTLLAAELSRRLSALGVAVVRLPAAPEAAGAWGGWFTRAVRRTLDETDAPIDAIGYAGAGSLALLSDAELESLVSPLRGEVVANNRFSADGFVVAGDG
jgi:hypothetical protein